MDRRIRHDATVRPKMAFRVLIMGGTGQVGAAVVRALAAEPSCAEVVMVNRKAIPLTADPRLRQVIVDTAAARFSADVTTLAQSLVAQGVAVYGASCVGVGTFVAEFISSAEPNGVVCFENTAMRKTSRALGTNLDAARQ
jgi:nucleoside-diphosphate-sugar epimerase